VIKAVRKFLFFSDSFCYYLRNQFDFPPLVAVGAGGRNSEHTVFRRGAAPEKIRTARTEGDNSGELKGQGMALFMGKRRGKNDKKKHKKRKN